MRVAVVLMVGFFLFSSYRVLQRAWDLKQATPPEGDWVTRYQRRFDGVKSMLPSHGAIAYLNDLYFGSDQGTIIPQYALAPRVLDRNAAQDRHALVLASYSDPALTPPPSTVTLRLVADFGNGVKLFRVE